MCGFVVRFASKVKEAETLFFSSLNMKRRKNGHAPLIKAVNYWYCTILILVYVMGSKPNKKHVVIL